MAKRQPPPTKAALNARLLKSDRYQLGVEHRLDNCLAGGKSNEDVSIPRRAHGLYHLFDVCFGSEPDIEQVATNVSLGPEAELAAAEQTTGFGALGCRTVAITSQDPSRNNRATQRSCRRRSARGFQTSQHIGRLCA